MCRWWWRSDLAAKDDRLNADAGNQPAIVSSRRIYVECTHTFFAGGNTGIRRVARNLANCAAAASDSETRIIPVVWGGIGFFTPKKQLSEAPHFLQRVHFVREFEESSTSIISLARCTKPSLRRYAGPFTWFKRLLHENVQAAGGFRVGVSALGYQFVSIQVSVRFQGGIA